MVGCRWSFTPPACSLAMVLPFLLVAALLGSAALSHYASIKTNMLVLTPARHSCRQTERFEGPSQFFLQVYVVLIQRMNVLGRSSEFWFGHSGQHRLEHLFWEDEQGRHRAHARGSHTKAGPLLMRTRNSPWKLGSAGRCLRASSKGFCSCSAQRRSGMWFSWRRPAAGD